MKKRSKKNLHDEETETNLLFMIDDMVSSCGVVAGDILLIDETKRNISLGLDALFLEQRTGIPMATTDKTINFKLHAKKLFQHYNLSFAEESRSDFLQKLSPDLKKWVAEPPMRRGKAAKVVSPEEAKAHKDQMNAVKALISDLLPNKGDAQSLEVVDYIISSKKKDLTSLALSADQSVSDVVREFVRENQDKWTAERGAGARLIHAPTPAKKNNRKTTAGDKGWLRYGKVAQEAGISEIDFADAKHYNSARGIPMTEKTVKEFRDRMNGKEST